MRGALLDQAFTDLTAKHREHPDVKQMPCEDLVKTLRASRWELEEVKKSMSAWVPPHDVPPSVETFKAAHSKFVALCLQVRSYVDQFSVIVPHDKEQIEKLKRHWRAERGKIQDALRDIKKLCEAVAKTAADTMYDAISPCKEIDINLGYTNITVTEDVQYDQPFFVPTREFVDEGSILRVHKECWKTFQTVNESKEFRVSYDQVMAAMSSKKNRAGRLTMELPDAFSWQEKNGDLDYVKGLKTLVQVFATEYWDISVRAMPTKHMAGMYQIVKGQFMVVIFPPDVCVSHSNLVQHIESGESTLLHKAMAFRAYEGSSFFAPFGHTVGMTAIAPEFVTAFLGNDAKAKAKWQKAPRVEAFTGCFIFHPLFEASVDAARSLELKNVCSFSYNQSLAFLPNSWQNSAGVVKYWKEVGKEAEQQIQDPKTAGNAGGD